MESCTVKAKNKRDSTVHAKKMITQMIYVRLARDERTDGLSDAEKMGKTSART